MKLFTFISLVLLFTAPLIVAQEREEISRNNAMSNVIGLSIEGGVMFGKTDYSTHTMNYTGKVSLAYYLPSTGQGNIGLRAFGQTGVMKGDGAPVIALNTSNRFSTQFYNVGAGLLYTLSLGDAVYPWIGAGASALWFYPRDDNRNALPRSTGEYKELMLAYDADLGLKIMISKSMSFDFAGGLIIASNDYLDGVKAGSGEDVMFTLTAGLSYNFGRNSDSDGDGVPDTDDACPETPAGVKVDALGCPLDADRDGVPDYIDKCANTPANVKVDAMGCPLDADGDGVPDYKDKCDNTPANITVDANGCPLDADSDGVPDYKDKCPNTPAKATVDALGCPLDSDGDSVPDYLDKCPNTPSGVQVDEEGCPIEKEVVFVPGETKSVVLSGDATFEYNKSTLLSNASIALDPLVVTMKANPKYRWEIGGFTDSDGSDSYNKKLSVQRAQSVADYLVNRGVDRNSLLIVGYGEENPISSNSTVEGKSQNRRVEVKLLSK